MDEFARLPSEERIAAIGGHLARAHDPPSGNIVIWRGWSRLMDLKIGADLIRSTYG